VTPVLEKIFFSVEHMHPELESGRSIEILKSDDINFIKTSNSLIDNKAGEEAIAATQE
jgi:hypothetical protein